MSAYSLLMPKNNIWKTQLFDITKTSLLFVSYIFFINVKTKNEL